ncbi:hypothetical protein pb186bvf_006436 [Paramecium bursaria]
MDSAHINYNLSKYIFIESSRRIDQQISTVLPKGKLNEQFGGTDGSNQETDPGKYRCQNHIPLEIGERNLSSFAVL